MTAQLDPSAARTLAGLISSIQADNPAQFWDHMTPWYLGEWAPGVARVIAERLVTVVTATWAPGSHVTLRDIEQFVHSVTVTVHESIPMNEFIAVDILWWLLTRSPQSQANLAVAAAETKWTVQVILLAKLLQLRPTAV